MDDHLHVTHVSEMVGAVGRCLGRLYPIWWVVVLELEIKPQMACIIKPRSATRLTYTECWTAAQCT